MTRTMIYAVLVFNLSGKPRLSQFFRSTLTAAEEFNVLQRVYTAVSRRSAADCNILRLPSLFSNAPALQDARIVYRLYATLYFVMLVSSTENELAILDLIQVFVESLDRIFENVCELDLVFHFEDVHAVLAEMVCGGVVVETRMDAIVKQAKEIMAASAKQSLQKSSLQTWMDSF